MLHYVSILCVCVCNDVVTYLHIGSLHRPSSYFVASSSLCEYSIVPIQVRRWISYRNSLSKTGARQRYNKEHGVHADFSDEIISILVQVFVLFLYRYIIISHSNIIMSCCCYVYLYLDEIKYYFDIFTRHLMMYYANFLIEKRLKRCYEFHWVLFINQNHIDLDSIQVEQDL